MQIAHLATDEIIVSDVRVSNSQESATYLASRIVVYVFLVIIGLISLFNIINSISMSVSGLLAGCIAGLLLSRMLYVRLITHYFGMIWRLPGKMICLLTLFVFSAVVLAVYGPAKRIRNMPITAVINEL